MFVPFAAVHEKVVPDVKLDKATDEVAPEHIVEVTGVAVAKGIGLTVIVTRIDVPTQVPAVGVTE